MKYKINYSKKGSEEVIDKLCSYIEKWKIRKQRSARSVASSRTVTRRPQNINRVDSVTRRQTVYSSPRVAQSRNKTSNTAPRTVRKNAEKQVKKICVSTVLAHIGISVLSFLLGLVILIVVAVNLLIYGPSESARDRFVLTVTETSAAGFLATWFMDDDIVNSIIENNAVVDGGGETDPTLIQLPGNENESNGGDSDEEVDMNSVQLINIEGKTYKGKLLIVRNPKRVYIGTPAAYGSDREGVTTIDMVRNDNALYGVNGGGFYDTGKGNGGIPTGRENSDGIVISKGKLMYGNKNSQYEVIGINKQGILVLGKMTAQEALDRGIVEALNFGPFLVMNGKACEVGGFTEAGLNPRTAIGQRADGAMLILTIDGRQPSSMGATYEDLIEIMMNYGAVNAANLDGGSSTYMAQNSETENNPQIITQCASLYGPRKMATSILVSRVDQINTQYEQNN
ncbi:MAG: phosphodiester glycosidase family protein [Ruminococcaceae bacterium]|nr:phosphodiester glycosidase family protein [Oscillospiraceae bacterium]